MRKSISRSCMSPCGLWDIRREMEGDRATMARAMYV